MFVGHYGPSFAVKALDKDNQVPLWLLFIAVQFVDVGREAGLNVPNVWGGTEHKRYIIEAKGSGLGFFDYDNDGWLDIYLTNGTRLGEKWPPGKAPTSQLFKNNRDGTFANVTEKSGLAKTGWQNGVCVGDYDNADTSQIGRDHV